MTDSLDSAITALPHRLPDEDATTRRSGLRWAALRAHAQILLVVGAAVTLTIVARVLSITIRTTYGHTMVYTVAGLIGILAAFVFAERASPARQLRDLLLATSLGIYGATDLILAVKPSLINAQPGDSWWWIVLAGRLVAGGILVGAAFCPALDVDTAPRLPRTILAAVAGLLVVIAAAMLMWHTHLPSLLYNSSSAAHGEPRARPLLGYMQLTGALFATAAAVGLARHSARHADGLERSIAGGVAMLAVARFNYFLIPSMSDDRLYAGDILKLGAYLMILYGCLIEFRTLQRKLVQRVAVDERRRMARDMHDGLAQELAFIASHSQRLHHTGEDAATVAHLRSAAERALHDSRTTIAVLTSPEELPLDELIVRTVDSFRSRFGVDVELDLQAGLVVEAERRTALLRILHEALINAVRHGSAGRILVTLGSDGHGPSLKVADDGCGFDVQAAVSAARGLGLTSMQERAGLLGGNLRIASTLGEGTVVEVELP